MEDPNTTERTEKDSNINVNNQGKKKKFILPLFLILMIVGAVGYICYEKHQEKVLEKEEELFRAIALSLVLDIFNEAITCNPIPINNGSIEINLIPIECLSKPEQ